MPEMIGSTMRAAPSMRFSPQNMALVREGMRQVVQAGTASQLRIDAQGKLLDPALMFAGKATPQDVVEKTQQAADAEK